MSDEHDLLDVLRLRYWHHLLNEMLKDKQFKIPIHLAFGHEAAAVAMDRVMTTHDKLCLTHRNVTYNLARIKSLDIVLAHYNLISPVSTGALMGSMNLATAETGIAYTSSILGNNLAVAAGIAMQRSLICKPSVVFALTGDGAIEEGIFWETLILAQSHKLPLVIVVENNDYSLGSTISERRSHIDLAKICAGIGLPYTHTQGTVVSDVRVALEKARELSAREGPSCVELNLAALCQHAGPTPGWPEDPLCITIEDGLFIENTPNDPLDHIREELGETEYQRMVEQVMGVEAR